MSLRWNGIIQRKLALMDQHLVKLEGHLRNIPRERFVEDWALRTISERTIQVCAEIMIDVCERIIALAGNGPTATAAEAVERLVQMGVLKAAEPYRSVVRMRNLIVHGYDVVDPEILFHAATSRLGDFRRFRDEIDLANARQDPRTSGEMPSSPSG
jgi:uncharacterized protein YutE (UPF0331/DUF86 family)